MPRDIKIYTSLSVKRENSQRLHELKHGKQTVDDVIDSMFEELESLRKEVRELKKNKSIGEYKEMKKI
jgi:hypothetical protein